MRWLAVIAASRPLVGCAGIPRVHGTGEIVSACVGSRGRATFLLAHIHAARDRVRIHGRVRSQRVGALIGHVDVEVTDALGDFVEVLHVPTKRQLGPGAYRYGSFEIELRLALPPGSTARFVYQRAG